MESVSRAGGWDWAQARWALDQPTTPGGQKAEPGSPQGHPQASQASEQRQKMKAFLKGGMEPQLRLWSHRDDCSVLTWGSVCTLRAEDYEGVLIKHFCCNTEWKSWSCPWARSGESTQDPRAGLHRGREPRRASASFCPGTLGKCFLQRTRSPEWKRCNIWEVN